MAKERVFLDNSVLITAVLSSRGGSFYIINNFRDKLEFQTNEYVLEEILKVLDKKFPKSENLKSKLFLLLGLAQIKILPNPSGKKVGALAKYINAEDAPILASALEHSRYLLTLDNDFLKDNVLKLSKTRRLIILKPREFIQRLKDN